MNNYPYLTHGYADGRYVLPPLPYEVTDLEALISAENLILHHDKHHAAYVAGANAAWDELRRPSYSAPQTLLVSQLTNELTFHLAGHILHTLYWNNLSPIQQILPEGRLSVAIQRSFGDFSRFEQMFKLVAQQVQGGGWAILGVEPVIGRLMICSVTRHQDALVPGFLPILVCDVWEHAYYPTWKNNRQGYISAFMQHINWFKVSEIYEQII